MILGKTMFSPLGTLERYLENGEGTNFKYLITAISYESRGLSSVTEIVKKFSIEKIVLISLGTDYLDHTLEKEWHSQRSKLIHLFEEKRIDYIEMSCHPVYFKDFFDRLSNETVQYPNIINISTFPKNYILRLAKEFDHENNLFFYSKSHYREPLDHELKISIDNIIPIEGFEGFREISSEDLLVLILGYEGHRALSFLSKFSPFKILPLISIPELGDENEDQMFFKILLKCNWILLRKQSVIKDRNNEYFKISSLSHTKFYYELSEIINSFLQKDMDLCISPLGTKPQALGLYLYWRENKNTQLIYSIPVKRLDFTQTKILQGSSEKELHPEVQNHIEHWIYRLPKKL